MAIKVKPKKKVLFCDPGVCDHCMYICEGDFICDKKRPEPVMVVCEWDPTDDYLWCKKRRNRRDERRLIDANALKKAKKKMCFQCWARHYLNCHALRVFDGCVEGCRRAKEQYERECENGNL